MDELVGINGLSFIEILKFNTDQLAKYLAVFLFISNLTAIAAAKENAISTPVAKPKTKEKEKAKEKAQTAPQGPQVAGGYPLIIEQVTGPEIVLNSQFVAEWNKTCGNLATLFGQGLFSLGVSPFRTVICRSPVLKAKAIKRKLKPEAIEFVLTVDAETVGTDIAISVTLNQLAGSTSREIAKVRLPQAPSPFKHLGDSSIALALKDLILAKSPVSNMVLINQRQSLNIRGKHLFHKVLQVTLHDPYFYEGVWNLPSVGVAKRMGGAFAKPFEVSKVTFLRYQMPKFYMIHPSFPKAQVIKKAEENLQDALKKKGVLNWLFDSLPLGSSRASVRYGLPLVQDGTILSKASNFSMSVELKSGSLEGLRWFWDLAPSVELIHPATESNSEIRESITWSRAALGWALKSDLPSIFSLVASEFEIIGKLGLTDFDLQTAATSQFSAVRVVKFRAKNVTDFGAEFALMGYGETIDHRISVGANYANSQFSLTKSTTNVTSARGTLELFLFSIPVGPFEMQLTVFGMGEWVKYENVKKKEAIESNDSDASGISFVQGFFGLGGTLSW